MRRAVLALSLGLPLVFAALPLGSLLFTDSGRGDNLPTVTIVNEVTFDQIEDPALAMRSEPQNDCVHGSTSRIDS